ncbi:MAG: acetoin dehydrogenase dihydrolipoyllysine-residue acetyltransferase subunit, partial [Pseudomonadota bacterium]
MSGEITPILMPKWGLSMKEGTLAAWLVEEGAQIAPGDEIMDVETDKIANVVEAADGGLLRRCVGQAGEVYPVRALLGVLAPQSVSDAEIEAYIGAYETPVVDDEEEAGPSYEFAELAIGRVRYAERPGDGVPFILIHGFGGDLDNWLFNIDALAEAAPVYALDLPGHGQSVKSVADPGLTGLTDAVAQFMDHLKIDRAHLVGHSMGGLVAGQIGLANPARAASLTLICSAGLGAEINGSYIDGFVGSASRRELKPHLSHLFADSGLVTRAMIEDLLKYKRLDGVQTFLDALAAELFAGGRQAHGIAAALGGLDLPVQIIWGAEDAVIPQAHAAAVPGASVSVIAGAGHMVQMEQAARVNDQIMAVL